MDLQNLPISRACCRHDFSPVLESSGPLYENSCMHVNRNVRTHHSFQRRNQGVVKKEAICVTIRERKDQGPGIE